MSKQHIKEWQNTLKYAGHPVGFVDGDFGPMTLKASKSALTGKSGNRGGKEALKRTKVEDAERSHKPTGQFNDDNRITLKSTGRKINEIIIHCAATREGQDYTAKQIDQWHKARGWSEIGYHYVVRPDGSIEVGRDISKVGAHVRGRNTGTLGICYIGGVDSANKFAKDTRTPAQKASLLWLTKELAKIHNIKKISGHNQYAAKACPSFDVRKDELGNIPGFKSGNKV